MKKLNYLLFGLAGLSLASCSNDDLLTDRVDDGLYHLTVKLPAEVATRAIGDGLTADNLYMAVYDADNNNAFIYKDLELSFNGQISTEVALNLAKGKSYNIAFFALSPTAASADVYNFNTTDGIIEVDYDAMESDPNIADAYDCFFKLYNITNFNGNTQYEEVLLNRPVAQVNWGTNDLTIDYPAITNNFGDNGEYIEATLNTTAYNKYSFFGGEDGTGDVVAEATTEVELLDFAAPTTASFPVSGYKYVAMQYLLAPQAETLYDLELTVSNAGKPNVTVIENAVEVANAPVQANYRTNIYGSLLTENVTLTVTKDKEWGTPDKNFELIDGTQYTVVYNGEYTKIRQGGNLILSGNFVYNSPTAGSYLIFNESTNLNLNGYTLSSDMPGTYDATVTIGGANVKDVTLSNGTIAPLENNTTAEPSLIFVRPVNNVQVTLNNITAVGMHPVWMNANTGGQDSKITINSGTYNSQSATSPAVYVSAYTGVNYAGQIVINGGTFGQAGITNPYLLNVLDRLRTDKDPREFIIVYGGTFINFNPADCASEGVPTNFVADGYTVVSSKKGDDTYYTVIPANYTPVSSQAALASAVTTPNANIYLQGGSYTFPNGVANGVTFIGSDNATITIGNSQQAGYENVTFQNIKFIGGTSYSGLQHSKNLKYVDCQFEGLIFSYAEGLVFQNCQFTQTLNDEYCIWTYTASPVTFTNCTFDTTGKAVLLYNELPSSTVNTVTFNGCNFKSPAPFGDKAAIQINGGTSFIVNINSCTQSNFSATGPSGNALYGYKTTAKTQIFVNGTQVYNSLN